MLPDAVQKEESGDSLQVPFKAWAIATHVSVKEEAIIYYPNKW